MTDFLDRWLQRGMVRFVSVAVLAVGLLGLGAMFLTSQSGKTAFGPPLGADFANFYNAGRILNLPGPEAEQLYDFDFQNRRYHELLPTLDEDLVNPFVHPPLVATVFRPLALLPYETAFLLWLGISAGLYIAGFLVAWAALPHLPRSERTDVLLVALAFGPFLMECWIGGQFSAVAFFFMASAYACEARGRPFASGVLLGVLLYKPTLLVLFLPLLLVGRRWRTLAGVAVSAAAMALLSLLAVGPRVCEDYVNALLGFSGTATQGTLQLKVGKWVDLNFFLQLLLGGPSSFQKALLVILSLPPLAFLIREWRHLDRDTTHRTLTWAATLTWTLVVNLYVGMYDTVLVVVAALLTADVLNRSGPDGRLELPRGFRYLLALLFVTAWASQPLAIALHSLSRGGTAIQVYTLALAALASYQLIRARLGVERPPASDD